MKIIFFIVFALLIVLPGLLLYIVFASRAEKLKERDYNLIGKIAVAETDLDPLGIVLVFGEAWKAVANVKVLKGKKVKIIATQGVLLKVEPILP